MFTRRHLAGIAIMLLTAGASSPLASQDSIPSSITSLSPKIVSVTDGGYWSNGTDEGFYRVVVAAAGVEHVTNSLYLQWVTTNIEDGSYTLVKSVSINEINDGHAQGHLIVTIRETGAEFGKLSMKVTVKRRGSEDAAKYRLTADGRPGSYRLMKTK